MGTPGRCASAVLVMAALCVSHRANAQAPGSAPPTDSSRLAAARSVLEASGAAQSMISAMRAQIPAQKQAMPQLPPEFWDRIEERMVHDTPELVDSIAVLYATSFTIQELRQLVAFYESPVGRRLAEVQPALVTQSSAIGQRWGMRIGAAVGASLSPR